MLARRLALVVAVVAVLALVAFLVLRDDGGIDRKDSAPDPSIATAGAAHVDLAAVTADVERSAADAPPRPAPATASPSVGALVVGRTFGELLRPMAQLTSLPLRDATIVCSNAVGEQRRAQLDDIVLAGDFEAQALWIVAAAEHCPFVVDPQFVEKQAAADEALPLDVPLAPCTSVALNFDVTEPRAIERVLLMPRSGTLRAPNWFHEGGPRREQLPWSYVALCEDVLALVHGSLAAEGVAHRIARIRAASLGPWKGLESRRGEGPSFSDSAAWSWRYAPTSTPTTGRVLFENVPVESLLALVVAGRVPFVFTRGDGSQLLSRVDVAAACCSGLELITGQTTELYVRAVAPAVLRGRFPEAALPDRRLLLEGVRDAAIDEHGAFEWPLLDAGNYTFSAMWEEPGGVSREVVHEIELDEGEVHDLGELRPLFAGRLTIHAQLDVQGALPPEFGAASLVATIMVLGPIDTDEQPDPRVAWGPNRDHRVVFGEPLVVDGIEPGTYRIDLRWVRSLQEDDDMNVERSVAEAQKLAALATGADRRLLELLNPGVYAIVEVDEDASVEVVAKVALAGACTLTVPIPASPTNRQSDIRVEFIRADGGQRREGGHLERTPLGYEASTGTLTQFLPPGDWIAIVSYVLNRNIHGPAEFQVARVDFTVTSGVHTTVAGPLEPAARLRLPDDYEGSFEVVLAELGERGHVGMQLVQSTTGSVIDALLPNTRYRFGERVIETGAPGSEVVLE
jgi:hypothetical protein